MKTLNDLPVDFYLELKKNEVDKTKFPLYLDIAESMTIEGNHTPTIQLSQLHQEVYFLDQSPNENEVKIPNAS